MLTVNGVRACTLLALCRLARGIHLLQVGALTAAGASSLDTSGSEHVSRVPYIFIRRKITYIIKKVKPFLRIFLFKVKTEL